MFVQSLTRAAIIATVATAAVAQPAPSEFVVSGKAALELLDATSINEATAERIAEACAASAKTHNVPVAIAVLDPFGNYVHFQRSDGATYLNVKYAVARAQSSLLARQPSRTQMNRVNGNLDMELRSLVLGYFPSAGGLPIVVNHQLIGVVGVASSADAGDGGWSDEQCASAAVEQVVGSQAPLPPLLAGKTRPSPPANPGWPPQARFVKPQEFPPDWVVSGQAAERLHEKNQISVEAAKKVARGCRDYAVAHGGTASVIILDQFGSLVYMRRMDNQPPGNLRVAFTKAQTAALSREPSSLREETTQTDPIRRAEEYQFGLRPYAGGLPIIIDGQMIGAIGVGGPTGVDRSGDDAECAETALKAVFGAHVQTFAAQPKK
jgi:glc operon protein GlcG